MMEWYCYKVKIIIHGVDQTVDKHQAMSMKLQAKNIKEKTSEFSVFFVHYKYQKCKVDH